MTTEIIEQNYVLKEIIAEGILDTHQREAIADALAQLQALERLEDFFKTEGKPDDMDLPEDTPVADVALAILKMVRQGQKASLELMRVQSDGKLYQELVDPEHIGKTGTPTNETIVLGSLLSEMTDEYIDQEIADLTREKHLLADLFTRRITPEQHDKQSKYKTIDMSLIEGARGELKRERFRRQQIEQAKTDEIRNKAL